MEWIEKEISIGEISNLLGEYEIEVDSPDGFVKISDFIDKGYWEEYILYVDNEKIVRCNEKHLFETDVGWKSAKEIFETDKKYNFITNKGNKSGYVMKTNNLIPIVDIQVEHENHRYYTNGISSHNTHVGKTSMKCNLAAMYLLQGYNVLYFTMEMSEEEIGKRIDANLLDIPMDEFNTNLNKDYFTNRVNKLRNKNLGKLKIKEYPSGYPSVIDFESYISELKIKEGFSPDVVIIDYLTIMTSARYKAGTVNSYTLYKSVSEELRGMGQKNNCAIWTSMQVNRGGYNASDVDFNDIAESFAVAMTADFSLAMTVTEELISMDQVLCKQIKNRYRNMYLDKRFVIGFDRIKQRFYDCDESAQEDLIDDDIPIMDKGNFETSHKDRHGKPSKIKGKYNF
jgi:hypothetical protein